MLRSVMYVTVLRDLKEHIEIFFPRSLVQTLSTNNHDGIIIRWLFNGLHRKGWVSAVACALPAPPSPAPAQAVTVIGSCDGLHLDFGGGMAT